jgi:peptide/nickel transport system substrate-binding protein
MALEGLVSPGRDGRTKPVFAESWTTSNDGLTWNLLLRPGVRFHSGNPADASAIRDILLAQLPAAMGPAFEDVANIRAVSDTGLEITLKRPSTFLMERLDIVSIQEAGTLSSGVGPFFVTSEHADEIQMDANERYYGGRPRIDRIVIKPYVSLRSAWADMLRGQIDMLYDVGVEALDSLTSSRDVQVHAFQRGYAFLVLLNVGKPYLRDPAIRRELNAAIDRTSIVSDVLRGHGTPALAPVWPEHWAYSHIAPTFQFAPNAVNAGKSPLHLKCLLIDPSHERLGLAIQRQLAAVGVDLELEMVTAGEGVKRVESGDFDAFLADFLQGPNLARPYLFWHSGAPYNYGHFSNVNVDGALDTIRHAQGDAVYRSGVEAFQRAVAEDPPAIFIAWRERARAVSRRFYVPAEPDSEPLTTIHRWRPAIDVTVASRN